MAETKGKDASRNNVVVKVRPRCFVQLRAAQVARACVLCVCGISVYRRRETRERGSGREGVAATEGDEGAVVSVVPFVLESLSARRMHTLATHFEPWTEQASACKLVFRITPCQNTLRAGCHVYGGVIHQVRGSPPVVRSVSKCAGVLFCVFPLSDAIDKFKTERTFPEDGGCNTLKHLSQVAAGHRTFTFPSAVLHTSSHPHSACVYIEGMNEISQG